MKTMKFKTIGLAIAAMTSFAASSQAALVFTETTRASDGWTIVTFTGGTGDWTVPLGVTTVEVLVGGGGGGGGSGMSGGDGVVIIADIPEPSTALLGGLGMLCLLRLRRNA